MFVVNRQMKYEYELKMTHVEHMTKNTENIKAQNDDTNVAKYINIYM